MSSQSAQEIPTDPLLFSTRKTVLGDRTWGAEEPALRGGGVFLADANVFEKIVVL